MDVRYDVISELGRGSFATVFTVKSSVTGTLYAAKVAKEKKSKMVLNKEAQIHSRLTHPNILQFISSFESMSCGSSSILPLPSEAYGTCGIMILELCTSQTLAAFTMPKDKPAMARIS